MTVKFLYGGLEVGVREEVVTEMLQHLALEKKSTTTTKLNK